MARGTVVGFIVPEFVDVIPDGQFVISNPFNVIGEFILITGILAIIVIVEHEHLVAEFITILWINRFHIITIIVQYFLVGFEFLDILVIDFDPIVLDIIL